MFCWETLDPGIYLDTTWHNQLPRTPLLELPGEHGKEILSTEMASNFPNSDWESV